MKKLILKTALQIAASLSVLVGAAGTAHATFEGRDATGAASFICTATGAGKCTYFYDNVLDITILNDWNIGKGTWSQAQTFAEQAGFTASGLTGWVLPTGDGGSSVVAQNQYLSIWESVGSTYQGLAAQFDGVDGAMIVDAAANGPSGNTEPGGPSGNAQYWSSSVDIPQVTAWGFYSADGAQDTYSFDTDYLFVVAVRLGDVAVSPIPEPETYALMLAGLGLVGFMARRRKAK
jgi:hypothetical protein